jgi:hypothetical protein
MLLIINGNDDNNDNWNEEPKLPFATECSQVRGGESQRSRNKVHLGRSPETAVVDQL